MHAFVRLSFSRIGTGAEPVMEKISESICLKLKGHLHKIIVER
jgi:hypothetical protein